MFDEDYNVVELLDLISGSIKTIDIFHHEIHLGDIQSYTKIHTIANEGAQTIAFTVGSNSIHLKPGSFISGFGRITFSLQEGATITGGNVVPSYNRNRNSIKTSSTVIKEGVTVSVAGTFIDYDYIGGSSTTGGKGAGDNSQTNDEWVLKPNTNYVFTITNNSGAESKVLTKIIFYEGE